MENSTTQILPDLPCSISGSTSISFSTANYMTSTVPSWTAIDSVSGILSINAPVVSSDTEHDFYINSSVSGASSPIQKLVKLIITNCAAKNWKKCISTSTLTCETCLLGYVLSSGVWDISNTVKVISKIITEVPFVIRSKKALFELFERGRMKTANKNILTILLELSSKIYKF